MLKQTITDKPPGNVTHWTGRAMATVCGLSLRTVQRIWDAQSLQPHRVRTLKRSNDPRFAVKLDDVPICRMGIFRAFPISGNGRT